MAARIEDPVVIAGFARTPIGAFQGCLSTLDAQRLGSIAIAAVLRRAAVDVAAVDQVMMGCVLAAGLGQAPARQAALSAGLPLSSAATTVNKMCGSGMQAAILAHDTLLSDSASVIVAGGMESMSNAPYLVQRRLPRVGHAKLVDSMLLDGLEDAQCRGTLMGVFAEEEAERRSISRSAMDAYATLSLKRALRARETGAFDREIQAVDVDGQTVTRDEQPDRADPARIASLPPVFRAGGSITAASSSSISDGAAALVMTRRSTATALGLNVAVQVAGHGVFADAAPAYPVAPAKAIRKLLSKVGWRIEDVELFEINEAFALVPLVVMDELRIGYERVNVRGGACALGHPIGASGARIVGTLMCEMIDRNARRGIAAACLGGGEAVAIALELPA